MKVTEIVTQVFYAWLVDNYCSKWKVKDILLLGESRTWEGLCYAHYDIGKHTISMTASDDSTKDEMNNKDVIFHYLDPFHI